METLDLHKKDESFKPTREELDTIRRKMDDPEFLKLWAEYAKDLQDPKYRAEEEEYLKQVEKEAREGGDYSFEFIFPEPAFAARLLNDRKKQTTFLNICSSDKVDVFSESRIANSRDASWQVPIVVGKPHEEDYEGLRVQVYDCVFHPQTVGLANKSDRFMCFVIEIAIENINEGYKQRYGFEFQRLQLRSIGTPKNQTIRKKGSEPMFPRATGPISVKPSAPTESPSPAVSTAPKKTETTAPVHTVLHRGQVDLTDAWNWQKLDKRIGIPKELVVKFELPKVERASELEVEVLGHSISLVSPSARYEVVVPLPFTVDDTPTEARFDKARRTLQVVLAVIPPEVPPVPTHESDARSETVAEEQASSEEPEASGSTPSSDTVPAAPPPEVRAPPEASIPTEASTKQTNGDEAASEETGTQDVLARVAAARKAREAVEQASADAEAGTRQADNVAVTTETSKGSSHDPQSAPQEPVEVVDLRRKHPTAEAAVVIDDDTPHDPVEVLAAQKKLRAAREADRAAATLAQKMSELPLCSRHIFAID